jgi:hypothetical protein
MKKWREQNSGMSMVWREMIAMWIWMKMMMIID